MGATSDERGHGGTRVETNVPGTLQLDLIQFVQSGTRKYWKFLESDAWLGILFASRQFLQLSDTWWATLQSARGLTY